jgi:ComF family protein
LCATCGASRPVGAACGCADRPSHIAAIASAARYDGTMRAIVQAFKYGGHQSLGAALAARLATHPHLRLDEIDLVVPVPLHPWRRFARGFNQAERLARHLGPPVSHALARLTWRPSQAGLPAAQRRANVRGAVTLRPALTSHRSRALRSALAGARVLLVDDVVTTGGTLSACGMVLREAGVQEVRAATAARTPRPSGG